METYKFKITIQKQLPINLSIKDIRKYPIIQHRLFETRITHVVYEHTPIPNLNKDEYLKVLMKSIVEQFENETTTSSIELIN